MVAPPTTGSHHSSTAKDGEDCGRGVTGWINLGRGRRSYGGGCLSTFINSFLPYS